MAVVGKLSAVEVAKAKGPAVLHDGGGLYLRIAPTGAMGRDDLTAHGFRSSFSDWAAERTPYPREVVEMALAHVIGNKVEAAYRRGDLFEKRRQLMETWGRFCTAPTASGDVVALRAGA